MNIYKTVLLFYVSFSFSDLLEQDTFLQLEFERMSEMLRDLHLNLSSEEKVCMALPRDKIL